MTLKEAYKEIGKLGFRKNKNYRDKYNNILVQFGTIPSNNKAMEKSVYHSNEKEFIHFSSIEGLNSILNSKHFRLYNLQNMDDKTELNWAKEQLKFENLLNDNDKENLYCLSMCSSNVIDKNEPKENLLWKIHGRDGKGILFKLKISNEPLFWYNYHLINVKYDTKDAEAIKVINEEDSKTILDQKICSFIKNPIYSFEEETRIIFENRENYRVTVSKDNKTIYPIVIPDKLLKTDIVNYIEIPIWNFFRDDERKFDAPNVEGVQYKIPKIEITEIVLGYRYSKKDKSNINQKINQYDSNIKVTRTALAKYY